MVKPSRSLIINADDFGYNDAITQGILKGYREGIITTTSAIMNIPGAAERVAAARANDPTLPIGLHLNLTAGRPVLTAERVPHLIRPDGTFFPFESFLPRVSAIPIDEIRAEAAAQAELLIQAGVVFDHIDYHQHIFALNASLFNIVEEMARKYQVPIRQPVAKAFSRRTILRDRRKILNATKLIVGAIYRYPRGVVDLLPIVFSFRRRNPVAVQLGTTHWFITTFFGDPTLANLYAILRQLPPGLSEIMVHPALEAPELLTMEEEYRVERYHELAVLLDPRAREEIERLGIRLTDFSSAVNPRYPMGD